MTAKPHISHSWQSESRAVTISVDASFLRHLIELAIHGLASLYDDRKKLFIDRIQDGIPSTMPQAWSVRYSAIALLGVLRARQHGWDSIPIDEGEILQSVVEQIDQSTRVGDLGLMLWADSQCEGRYRDTLVSAIKRQAPVEKLPQMSTMELAWLLTGVCYAHIRSGHDPDTEILALEIYEAIMCNFHAETGLFFHSQTRAWPARVRRQIGNFADQIYAIYALATFNEAFRRKEALKQALKCAHRLCALQGDEGQWWWLYDVRRGEIASRYPVFAVHQDGMAPMALLKLSAVSGQDFQAAILRGLRWLQGSNELKVQLIDWDRDVVWRDIELRFPGAYLQYIQMALVGMGYSGAMRLLKSVSSYKINYEMRPYHLGWLLYALADPRSILLLEGNSIEAPLK